ncbi:MAG: PIG-L family deacetylase [Bacteroidetes bacterium]|nr:PIG-L family deacetylase [Bacteroidota bacterium]
MSFHLFCIFPHPDDETFLMGGSIASVAARGHTVSLYTLTRGEHSRHGKILGLSSDEVGRRRSLELQRAADILGVSTLLHSSYPDGGLRDMDPRLLEQDIAAKIRSHRPHVLCTFDVQGASVHPDHITVHHAVKRVYCSLYDEIPEMQRLCFCVLPDDRVSGWPRKIFGVPQDRIHAVIDVSAVRNTEQRALHVHTTVAQDVREHNYDNWMLWEQEYFSFYRESPKPPVSDLFDGLQS